MNTGHNQTICVKKEKLVNKNMEKCSIPLTSKEIIIKIMRHHFIPTLSQIRIPRTIEVVHLYPCTINGYDNTFWRVNIIINCQNGVLWFRNVISMHLFKKIQKIFLNLHKNFHSNIVIPKQNKQKTGLCALQLGNGE